MERGLDTSNLKLLKSYEGGNVDVKETLIFDVVRICEPRSSATRLPSKCGRTRRVACGHVTPQCGVLQNKNGSHPPVKRRYICKLKIEASAYLVCML